MGVPQFPSGQNVFVPDHDGSGRLVVDFSRNPNKFAIADYAQIVKPKRTIGYYMAMTVEEAGRIINSDLADFAWPDGAEAPQSQDGTESFEFKAFRCERFAFDYVLGDLTVEQASWDIKGQHARIKAQQAMTGRTQKAMTKLQTSGNWASTHTSAVSSISGNTGNWAASTTARQDIKRSLNYAADLILKDTLGAIDINDLMLVIAPTTAKALSETQEIVDHIKGSPDALAQVRGELPGKNAMFGLPDKLYGFPIVVEKTVKTTSRKGATRAVSYVCDYQKPIMVARPGGLEGVADAPNFSTVVLFMYEEMTVEDKHDTENRRLKGRVVENYAVELVASVSGFLFTGAV